MGDISLSVFQGPLYTQLLGSVLADKKTVGGVLEIWDQVEVWVAFPG